MSGNVLGQCDACGFENTRPAASSKISIYAYGKSRKGDVTWERSTCWEF